MQSPKALGNSTLPVSSYALGVTLQCKAASILSKLMVAPHVLITCAAQHSLMRCLRSRRMHRT